MKVVRRAPSALLAFACFAVFFGVFFLPATFGKLMASGDALVESVPAFLGEHRLWESRIFLGYPMYADPNQQLMYPLQSTPNEVRIASACARECFAVLRDASSNDWPVTVDDRPAKVFVTDVDLRGVAVPAGKHLVRYRFFPIPLMVGIAITLSSALALLGSIVISRRTNGTELRNVTRAER